MITIIFLFPQVCHLMYTDRSSYLWDSCSPFIFSTFDNISSTLNVFLEETDKQNNHFSTGKSKQITLYCHYNRQLGNLIFIIIFNKINYGWLAITMSTIKTVYIINTADKPSSPISNVNFSMKPFVIIPKPEWFLLTYNTWFIFILTFPKYETYINILFLLLYYKLLMGRDCFFPR